MKKLLGDLQIKNPWWSNAPSLLPEAGFAKRDLFFEVEENLEHSLIINIIGLRRVGKSTILKQLIAKLLSESVPPQNICYFLFDYASQTKTGEFLEEVLSCYLKEILQTTVTAMQDRVYIFLDEVQYIEDWPVVLKKYYDLSGKKVKFIISGSQSLLLKNKNKETLAGRIFDYFLPPLSFPEFLSVNNLQIDGTLQFDLFTLSQSFADLSQYDLQNQSRLKTLADRYVTVGQFPEIELFSSYENKHEYIMESVLGKILEDCIRIFNIDKPNEFKLIAYHLLNNAGSFFEVRNLSQEIGVSHLTVEKYLEYLQISYVIEIVFKYHKSLIKRGRILKKVYATTTNFTCALNRYTFNHLAEVPDAFGKIMENLICNVLARKYFSKGEISNTISFWRDGNKEIDFIIQHEKRILPLEVKFTDHLRDKELHYLAQYLDEKHLEYGVVVTKKLLDKRSIAGKNIYFIPYYLFLLIDA